MSLMMRAAIASVLAAASFAPLLAAESWSEVKTPHFIVWSSAGDGASRSVAWQLEQLRSVLAAMWPWATVDLAKPLHVFVVKDENGMRAMAPLYWERKGDLRPVSLWVTGLDQHYLLIRADVRTPDTSTLNPHTSSYFSYANLVIESSFDRALPVWFSRGLAGVLSNTLVRDDHILLGPPIPWHVETLRDQPRFRLAQLITMKRSAPEFNQGDALRRFDAHAWALVHFLMFGENGAYQAALNRLTAALNAGKDPDAAFAEAIGRVDEIEGKLLTYVQRRIFSYGRVKVDAGVKRERLPVQRLPAAESAAGRARFHVDMGRIGDAQALVAEARKADASAAAGHLAEALLLDRTRKPDEARDAYAKAVAAGTTSPWAHYRMAMLKWPVSQPDQATLQEIEKHLARAVELQDSFAAACSALAEARAALGRPQPEVIALLKKAIAIEPGDPWHRLAAARVLWRLGSHDEARRTAKAALDIADSDEARREAERLLASIPTSKQSRRAAQRQECSWRTKP